MSMYSAQLYDIGDISGFITHQSIEPRVLNAVGTCPEEVYDLNDTKIQIFKYKENTNFHNYTGMCQRS